MKNLLQILLKHIDDYVIDNPFKSKTIYNKFNRRIGFCHIIYNLQNQNIINVKEAERIISYIRANVKNHYDMNWVFEPGNYSDRKKWLEQQIDKL